MPNSELRELVDRTFRDLLHYWVGAKQDSVLRIYDYDRLLEFSLELPSFFSGVTPLKSGWMVLSLEGTPEEANIALLDVPCYRVSLTPTESSIIDDFQQRHPLTYFLLATPRLSIKDVAGERPDERFDLYAVDTKQLFNLLNCEREKKTHILIPSANKLDLTTFTLLWASQWVFHFFSPIRKLFIGKSHHDLVPDITKTLVATAFPRIEHGASEEWIKVFTEHLKMMQPNLIANGDETALVRLHMGFELQSIVNKMQRTDIDKILVYCPEALHGTAALWLFSRFYHQFMKSSGSVIHDRKDKHNVRFFPFDIDHTNHVSKVIRRALILIQTYYKYVGVETRIVAMPNDSPQKDRSFYGGGIGHFPWYEFSGTGVNFHGPKHGDVQESLEFLNSLRDRIIVRDNSDILTISENLSLAVHDLGGAIGPCPQLLFVPEDNFIEHPRLLWLNKR